MLNPNPIWKLKHLASLRAEKSKREENPVTQEDGAGQKMQRRLEAQKYKQAMQDASEQAKKANEGNPLITGIPGSTKDGIPRWFEFAPKDYTNFSKLTTSTRDLDVSTRCTKINGKCRLTLRLGKMRYIGDSDFKEKYLGDPYGKFLIPPPPRRTNPCFAYCNSLEWPPITIRAVLEPFMMEIERLFPLALRILGKNSTITNWKTIITFVAFKPVPGSKTDSSLSVLYSRDIDMQKEQQSGDGVFSISYNGKVLLYYAHDRDSSSVDLPVPDKLGEIFKRTLPIMGTIGLDLIPPPGGLLIKGTGRKLRYTGLAIFGLDLSALIDKS